MNTHKKHVYLTYDEILDVQRRLANGESARSVAKVYDTSVGTIHSFNPKSKMYRPDLLRIRKGGLMFVKSGGNTGEKPIAKPSGNTGKPAVKLTREAKEYIEAAEIVFGKSQSEIIDDMVKATKIIGAATVHGY